jgi:hypothetical protein
MSLASHYNSRVKPVEVMVEAGTVRVVRRRETLEETFAAETV